VERLFSGKIERYSFERKKSEGGRKRYSKMVGRGIVIFSSIEIDEKYFQETQLLLQELITIGKPTSHF